MEELKKLLFNISGMGASFGLLAQVVMHPEVMASIGAKAFWITLILAIGLCFLDSE